LTNVVVLVTVAAPPSAAVTGLLTIRTTVIDPVLAIGRFGLHAANDPPEAESGRLSVTVGVACPHEGNPLAAPDCGTLPLQPRVASVSPWTGAALIVAEIVVAAGTNETRTGGGIAILGAIAVVVTVGLAEVAVGPAMAEVAASATPVAIRNTHRPRSMIFDRLRADRRAGWTEMHHHRFGSVSTKRGDKLPRGNDG
jgi:hypothetical protein